MTGESFHSLSTRFKTKYHTTRFSNILPFGIDGIWHFADTVIVKYQVACHFEDVLQVSHALCCHSSAERSVVFYSCIRGALPWRAWWHHSISSLSFGWVACLHKAPSSYRWFTRTTGDISQSSCNPDTKVSTSNLCCIQDERATKWDPSLTMKMSKCQRHTSWEELQPCNIQASFPWWLCRIHQDVWDHRFVYYTDRMCSFIRAAKLCWFQ